MGFISKCNLTGSPACRLPSSILPPHSPAVTEGVVKNKQLYELPTVFKCLCRYFQNCIDFDFWHVSLSTLLTDTANQDASHGNLPGASDMNKNAVPLFIVPYTANLSKTWEHSLCCVKWIKAHSDARNLIHSALHLPCNQPACILTVMPQSQLAHARIVEWCNSTFLFPI